MARYQHGDIDEDGDEVIVCTECDGTGDGEEFELDDEGDETATREPCPVCCGFGRLDW